MSGGKGSREASEHAQADWRGSVVMAGGASEGPPSQRHAAPKADGRGNDAGGSPCWWLGRGQVAGGGGAWKPPGRPRQASKNIPRAKRSGSARCTGAAGTGNDARERAGVGGTTAKRARCGRKRRARVPAGGVSRTSPGLRTSRRILHRYVLIQDCAEKGATRTEAAPEGGRKSGNIWVELKVGPGRPRAPDAAAGGWERQCGAARWG